MNKKITDRNISMFMYFNLTKQAFEWQAGLIGMYNQKMKMRFNNAMNANRLLIEEMERELEGYDSHHKEQFQNDSEYFSKCLELIRKAPTPEKKQELIHLMMEYINGNIKIE